MATEEVNVRRFNWDKDRESVEELERVCDSHFLVSDSSGDPLCRVRNSPAFEMLVAESGSQLVGIVRGSIKMVTISGQHKAKGEAKVGYVLGLRVSPLCRRRGVGSLLVSKMEEWFLTNLVDYSYMATDAGNEASIKLFTEKLGYTKFARLRILVNSVGRGPIQVPSSVVVRKLEIAQAERLYRTSMSSSHEFFPQDIGHILANKLSLGTWIAHRRNEPWDEDRPAASSWAVLSVWNCREVYTLRVARAPLACVLMAKVLRLVGRVLPCLERQLAVPDIFTSFGFYFMYGLHGEGPEAVPLLQSLCYHVHNLATTSEDCRVIVTEVGDRDHGIRPCIPRSRLLSCLEDQWCIKPLRETQEFALFSARGDEEAVPTSLFVDPREL